MTVNLKPMASNITFDKQASLAEIESGLKAARIPLQRCLNGPDYATNDHFVLHVLTGINTVDDALEFAKQLDRDRLVWEKQYNHLSGECRKAWLIRIWLENPAWTVSANRLRIAIAHQRSAHCGCHETGSFAKSRK